MPTISLAPRFEDFIRHEIAQGRYRDASEVVQAGLELLAGRAESRDAARRLIDEAFDDPRPVLSADEVFTRLRAHHEAQLRADDERPGNGRAETDAR